MEAKILTGKEAETTLTEIANHYYDHQDYNKHLVSGYFHDDQSDTWIAFDNTTADCWVEEFDTEREAIGYVNGEFY